MAGIQYCMNCKHDGGGGKPCAYGRRWIRNVPVSCEFFDGELYYRQKRKINSPIYGHEDTNQGMIRITAYEILNDNDTDYQDHVTGKFQVEGKTLEECFRKLYPSKRSLRYCSGRRIQLKDLEIHEKWEKWSDTGVTMEMFYGSATVD